MSLIPTTSAVQSGTPLPLPIITTDADDDEILTAIAIAAVYFLWGVAFVLFVVATIRLYIAIETWCERRAAAAAAASRGRSKPPSAWSQTKRFFKSWQKTRNWGGVSMEDGEREPLWNPSASTNSNVNEEAGNR